jgi:hypothetical protein
MNVEPGQVKGIFLHAVENRAPGEWGAAIPAEAAAWLAGNETKH